MEEKLFEIMHEPTQQKEKRTEKEIYDLRLPSMFTSMVVKMKLGESMYHQLTRCNFTRIK